MFLEGKSEILTFLLNTTKGFASKADFTVAESLNTAIPLWNRNCLSLMRISKQRSSPKVSSRETMSFLLARTEMLPRYRQLSKLR